MKLWQGHKLNGKGGGTLFTSDGKFNSAGCMRSLFALGSNLTNHRYTYAIRPHHSSSHGCV